jgi:hypothetical protein
MTIYVYSGPLSHPVRGFTTTSKFVLYDNGAFYLEYAGISHRYHGVYQQENNRISFDLNADGRPDASGDRHGELLEVRYSESMHHADFEDAVYRRSN